MPKKLIMYPLGVFTIGMHVVHSSMYLTSVALETFFMDK
jgi:hypothetical protein